MDVRELIGVTLGTCTLERIIGRGGMGAVYLAQQARPARTVAVKVLIPADAVDPDQQRVFLARFRREADTIAKLEHKNILPLYEYDEEMVLGARLAYLVMPYIRGGTLRERIDEMRPDRRQFDLNVVVSYIGQVADALSYAHSLGVVHRDIKPGNLLFHQDGRVLLSDFGIVHLSAMPALTMVGSFVGTVEYSSPEQVSGGTLDARSDIYALGIILYELLTGNVPFSGPNPFAVMAKQLNDPVPSVRVARPDLSPAIEFVVKKALAKRPEDRYQSATEMADDLRVAVSSAVLSPQPLRLGGDASYLDRTVADRAPMWQATQAAAQRQSAVPALEAFPPTRPALPGYSPDEVGAPFVASPVGGNGFGAAQQAVAPPQPVHTTGAQAHKQGRRLFYYGTLLLALPLQALIFLLLFAQVQLGSGPAAVLGLLLGASINFLALGAIVFTGVTRLHQRRRHCTKAFYSCLALALVAPFGSGFFVDFGLAGKSGLHLPIVAYLVLLLSNILAIRELGRVDAAREQIEDAPVVWLPAAVGAVTGLLPLTLLLIFALTVPTVFVPASPPLFTLLGVFVLAFLGSPTPGAMLAVWLSGKVTYPVLLRSSGLAGMLMFLGALLLVFLWGLLMASHALLFSHFGQPLLAWLVGAGLLGLIGWLRGMLDAWVYQGMRGRKKASV